MDFIGCIIILALVGFIIYIKKPEWFDKILGFFKKSKQPEKATRAQMTLKRERDEISRARRHKIIVRVLFIYLIIDILVDFNLL